jgi:hypothetical protein
MKKYRLFLLVINLIGGSTVIGSYAWGLASRPDAADILWGGVPDSIRLFYTGGMLLAAAGYFAFTYFILFRIDPEHAKVVGRYGAGIFPCLYLGILVPSALWMPATFWAVDNPSASAIGIVRGILVLAALFSLGLLAALLGTRPRKPAWAHALAVAGAVCFCIQTVILDAGIWGVLFG